MNFAALGLAAAGVLGLVSAAAAVWVPRRARSGVVGVGTALTGAAGVLAGVGAVAGQPASMTLPGLLPLAGIAVAVDGLGGLFVVVTGVVGVWAGVYATAYTRGHGVDGRGASAVLPLFVLAMLFVPAASSVSTLLVCWELMALTSLLLVVAEHRRRAEVARAGLWYAVMTHLGFLAVLAGLLVFTAYAANDSFAALREAAGRLPAGVGTVVFTATLAGFASKAGIVPLHAWLPRAHPEAPSHVSALMSAAMVNLGVYGILRVGFDLLGGAAGGGVRGWWLLVLGLGAISAVYGILQAAMSTDLKRLLGQSTTENMGLVLVGVGAAGLFDTAGQPVLAGLALTAALLHVINHAAFKSVLFLAAGSVLRATGTRDLDALGGLRAGMPVTTALFGLGGLAASALPPGTAFVSEWLLLQALIHGLPDGSGGASTVTAVVMPVAVAAVALTAGLSVATFVKAFGVGFLAKPRSARAERARESPIGMLAGMGLAALACVGLAVLPASVLPVVSAATDTALGGRGDTAAVSGVATLQLTGVTGSLSPLLLAVALAVAGGVVLAATRAAVTARRAARSGPRRRAARLWDCGGGPLSARMEYTATSFAEPLQRVFDNVVAPETDVNVDHHQESRYLVRTVEYRHRVPDRIERRLYAPVLAAAARWGEAGRALATGSVHRYLGYGFYTVCGVLLVLAALR
ncbi:oxidoreductase [Pseudonocardia eucalypti]|uniref:Oxidoreductase n=1 Tax=Pseudonocardia eucalypti TaxID=648755 RepID=A0ABP9PQ11_9PSEU|nr:formate hydrogenlyase subunit 3/multisubunit Na+/H+ antiporter MnhD subunit [Pseudonocardia eucalypti]